MEIPECDHNPLDSSEIRLEDENKDTTVNWNSPPIYVNYLAKIQEINQVEVQEGEETNDFPVEPASLFEELKEENVKCEFTCNTHEFSKYTRLENIGFLGSKLSYSYLAQYVGDNATQFKVPKQHTMMAQN